MKELILLDTIPLSEDKRIDKIKMLPVAQHFSEAIARIYEEVPVSRSSPDGGAERKGMV